MCLKGAKSLESGAHIGMWADFGRFYAHRVIPLLERINGDSEYAKNVYDLFDEEGNAFRNKINERLVLIRKEFWGTGSGYIWDSIDTWDWEQS